MIAETSAVAVAAGFALLWQQGRRTLKAAERAARQAAEAVIQAKSIHVLVNSQRTEMLKLIAAQRAEIALLSGQPRPSDAVLGAPSPG
ncbi:MAG: hypothetical protein H0U97_12115 [Gammaproteobacteria bacterium]|nr:hypothetical protein [Gammaproteobacteria bacterium]